MQATQKELDALFEIQAIDLDICKFQRELDTLPQREIIVAARKKREEIKAKHKQVEALMKDTKKKLTKINDEDASLEKKEHGVQAAIEAAGNDFRNVESRTKELDGIFRRRNTLAEDRAAATAELEKISALEAQIVAALADLDAKEDEATESYKQQGGKLQRLIAEARAQHEALVETVSPEVGDLYEQTSKLFDTIFIGSLDGNKCSVCRTKIEAGHLIRLKDEAPLSKCPSCKRMLIIS